MEEPIIKIGGKERSMGDERQLTICVAGMHRSGTSMIARLLNLCGMDLGLESDMMPASPANPEGYWEHVWFNYYNNRILETFRGAWDLVPAFPNQWQNLPELEWARKEAAERIAQFKTPVWGWKDPRNSITLPFWRQLLPELKVVICLRNPLDVAASLNKRGSASITSGLRLWWQYSSMLLLSTTPQNRVVTHFDTYFPDGAAELRRVTAGLGMQTSDADIAQACPASKESLRHSVSDVKKLQETSPWTHLVECYCRLLVESGELSEAMFAEQWPLIEELAARWTPASCCVAIAPSVAGPDAGTADVSAEQKCLATDATIDQLTRELDQTRVALQQARSHTEQLQAAVAKSHEYLQAANAATELKGEQLEQSEKRVAQVEDQLHQTRDQLNQTQDHLRQTQDQLNQTQDQLRQTQDQLRLSQQNVSQEQTCRAQVESQRDQLHGSLIAVSDELAHIKASKTWRLLRKVDAVRMKLGVLKSAN